MYKRQDVEETTSLQLNRALTCDDTLKQKSLKSVATLVSKTAGANSAFKKIVYKLALRQNYGDYYLRLEDLLAQNNGFWTLSEVSTVQNCIAQFDCGASGRPIIFIPHLENVDSANYINSPAMYTGKPKICFDFEYNEITDLCPYYISNSSNKLILQGYISEDSAWKNDVWVFAEEEGNGGQFNPLDNANFVPTPMDTTKHNIIRQPNRKEWAGWVQVLNMKKIEKWTAGKFEFKYQIVDANGNTVKNRDFGQWKRKHFKDQKWFFLDDYVGIWDISVWGPFQIEHWMELDGGSTASFGITVPANNGNPGITITFPSQTLDDDLGSAMVQFNEPALPGADATTYNISYMNFRRQTQP